MATERDLWAAPPASFHVWAWHRATQREQIAQGLKAIAEVWFDYYTDETDLPNWFRLACSFLEDEALVGELDIPHWDECPECQGSGEIKYAPGRRYDPQNVVEEKCVHCNGTGCVPREKEDRYQ